MTRLLAIGGVVIVAVAAFFIIRGGSEDTYTVEMRLMNAGGLRNGSPVVVGGVPIGKVDLDATEEAVEVHLDIEEKYAPIGRDATASIIAQNVLGQKQVSVHLGDGKKNPAPEGWRIPASQVAESTDLDQLLSTLDPDTRTRLAILINETGTAFAGRKLDFKTFIEDFAPALTSGGLVLGQLSEDNHALENLIATSDRYIGGLSRERLKLSRMVDLVGRTTETVAMRRGALRETLRQAPGALASARSFLAELRQTTGPLAATARELEATAPSLRTTLARIEPFRVAATPALRGAISSGTRFNNLGRQSAKPLQGLVPLVESLKNISQQEVPPVGRTLDKSADNLLATVDNWSNAIQFRDGLGHIFRGEASFSPDFYESLVGRILGKPVLPASKRRAPTRSRARAEKPGAPAAQAPAAQAPAAEPKRPAAKAPLQLLKLDKLVQSLTAPKPQNQGQGSKPQNMTALLDYLLGH